jgi:hypothetical protein
MTPQRGSSSGLRTSAPGDNFQPHGKTVLCPGQKIIIKGNEKREEGDEMCLVGFVFSRSEMSELKKRKII